MAQQQTERGKNSKPDSSGKMKKGFSADEEAGDSVEGIQTNWDSSTGGNRAKTADQSGAISSKKSRTKH